MTVLIFKIGAIGDVVMMLSAIREIRERWPKASITWVCGETVAPLLRCVDTVDSLVTVDEKTLFGGFRGALASLWKVRRHLSGKSFDLVLLGHSDSRYRMFLRFFGVRIKKLMSFGRGLNGRIAPVPGRYHGDEYRRLVTGEEDWRMKEAIFPPLSLPPIPESLADVLSPNSGQYVAIAPGGARNYLANDRVRRWPIDHFVNLAERLLEKNLSVVILGDSGDLWVRPDFSHLETIDLIGKTSLVELLGVLSRMDAIVSNDSGLMHLAILQNLPIVALFGPTDPSGKIPKNPSEKIRVLWSADTLPCCPCYDGKTFAKCDNNLCLKNISVAEVEEAVESLLKLSRIPG
jgi:heptosyltransferase-2